jgi:hypothetical protein
MGICRVKALISAPLPRVWDFLIRPENMHLWGPLTQPVTDIDRPLQTGDRITQSRKDFFRSYSQVLLVEEVIPYRSLQFRDLSPAGVKLDARATISVEESADREATWIEEAIFYSFGNSRPVQWLDRWLANPLMQVAVGRKTNKAFRRLEAIFAAPDKKYDPLE